MVRHEKVELLESCGSDVCCPLGHPNTRFLVLQRAVTKKVLTVWFRCERCDHAYPVPEGIMEAWEMYLNRLKPIPSAPDYPIKRGVLTPVS